MKVDEIAKELDFLCKQEFVQSKTEPQIDFKVFWDLKHEKPSIQTWKEQTIIYKKKGFRIYYGSY